MLWNELEELVVGSSEIDIGTLNLTRHTDPVLLNEASLCDIFGMCSKALQTKSVQCLFVLPGEDRDYPEVVIGITTYLDAVWKRS